MASLSTICFSASTTESAHTAQNSTIRPQSANPGQSSLKKHLGFHCYSHQWQLGSYLFETVIYQVDGKIWHLQSHVTWLQVPNFSIFLTLQLVFIKPQLQRNSIWNFLAYNVNRPVPKWVCSNHWSSTSVISANEYTSSSKNSFAFVFFSEHGSRGSAVHHSSRVTVCAVSSRFSDFFLPPKTCVEIDWLWVRGEWVRACVCMVPSNGLALHSECIPAVQPLYPA